MVVIRIDPASAEPLFEQIVFAVKQAVARGGAAAGDRLPSVRELARELAINPNTVVRAYEALEHDGV
ncbi:MAG: GntR family transcriptional regulator, partial [Planctomycetes bacterium]|nr:GntR family transcriptional regulator [Planctomycetota bacterium]